MKKFLVEKKAISRYTGKLEIDERWVIEAETYEEACKKVLEDSGKYIISNYIERKVK